MSLFDDCIRQLGNQAKILSEEKSIELFDSLQDLFPFTFYGRIDWDKVHLKNNLKSLKEVTVPTETAYILWDNAMFPVIRSRFKKIVENIDEITKVSFDTWLFIPEYLVIEFYHEGEITIGYLR